MASSLVLTSLSIAFLWAISGIIQKQIVTSIPPEAAMTIMGIAYASVIVTFGMYNFDATLAAARTLTLGQWASVGFVAIGGVFIANLLLYRLLKVHDAHKVNTLTYVSPMFTLVLAALLLKEKVTAVSACGVLLTVVGIILVAH